MALALFLALYAANAALTGAQFTCNIDGYLNNCAHGPITEGECLERNCCWHEFGSGSEEPWCFYKNWGYEYCDADRYRSDCGELSTTKEQCIERGCCWNERHPYPSCFFPNTNDHTRCDIPIPDREPCGDGSNQNTCEKTCCCWDELEHGSAEPWCYSPLPPPLQKNSAKHCEKQVVV